MENKKNRNVTETEVRTSRSTSVAKAQPRRNGTTLAIIALSVLLGLSLLFGLTAAFFGANATASGDITLGDPVNINITQGGATVSTLTFGGDALPGTVYSQPISVALPADTSDAVIRGKLTITNSNSAAVNVSAETPDTWTLGDDDYYYYNGKLAAGETADFVTSITVPKTLTNEDANKTYALSVQIEAIQFANGAAAEVWTTAPTDWVSSYGSGTLA